MRSLTPIALLATLLIAPFAAAQVPPLPAEPTPIYSVAIANAPAAFPALAANGTASAPFQVVLTLANVVCTAAVTIPVDITATAVPSPAYFRVIVEPATINFTVPAGPYPGPPVGQPAGGTGDSAAVATIAGNITANASVQVTLTATAPAPAGCQGAGTPGAATSAPVVIYANMTETPQPPPEPTPEADSPGLGLLALVATVAAVAYGARRRRS